MAFVSWCWVARNFASILCFLSVLKEEERVASMMILICPIGLIVWTIAFIVSLLSFPVKDILVKLQSFIESRKYDESYNAVLHFLYDDIWDKWFGARVKKEDENDPIVLDDSYHLFCSSKHRKGSINNDVEMQNGENKMKWSDVRNVLTGVIDLFEYDPNRQYNQHSSDAALHLLFLQKFQEY